MIEIKNVNYDIFLEFLNFIYSGKLPKNEIKIKELHSMSIELKLIKLQRLCEDFIFQKYNQLFISDLSTHLSYILEKKLYCDCIFIVDKKEFQLHKFILSSRCEYFKKLLESQKDKNIFELHEENITKKIFTWIIYYIYTNTLQKFHNLSFEEAEILFLIAQKFELKELMKNIEFHLFAELTDQNVSSIFLLAEKNSMEILKKACIDYITINLKKLNKNKYLENLNEEFISTLKKKSKNIRKEKIKSEKKLKKLLLSQTKEKKKSSQSFFCKKKNELPMYSIYSNQKTPLTRRNSFRW